MQYQTHFYVIRIETLQTLLYVKKNQSQCCPKVLTISSCIKKFFAVLKQFEFFFCNAK